MQDALLYFLWQCGTVTIWSTSIYQEQKNLEAWHRVFQETVGLNHPQIYRLVKALIVEQGLNEAKMARLEAGEVVQMYSKRANQISNQQLQNIVADYENRPHRDFIGACALHFDL